MQKSATGILNPKKDQGFTLIELLVTVFIISITLLFISIVPNFNRIEDARANAVAQRLSLIIPIAQQEAILQPAEIGLVVTDVGYGFSEYQNDRWIPIRQKKRLKFYFFPKNIYFEVIINNTNVSVEEDFNLALPQIIFSSSGENTPFSIYINVLDRGPIFRLDGTENGELMVTKL